jgi:hypothetical protein
MLKLPALYFMDFADPVAEHSASVRQPADKDADGAANGVARTA